MVSPEHEAIAQLFHANPGFVVELLRDHFGVKVPDFKEARTGSENFTEWNPTEYRADVVIVLATPDPVMAVIVEVQRSTDKDKRRTWPLYLTTLRARLRCPAVLLVVCPDAGVATWCAKSIPIGHPGWDLKPLVLGPDLI